MVFAEFDVPASVFRRLLACGDRQFNRSKMPAPTAQIEIGCHKFHICHFPHATALEIEYCNIRESFTFAADTSCCSTSRHTKAAHLLGPFARFKPIFACTRTNMSNASLVIIFHPCPRTTSKLQSLILNEFVSPTFNVEVHDGLKMSWERRTAEHKCKHRFAISARRNIAN